MVYEFSYSGVVARCKMLSSFEGRDYVGDSGDSLYLRVKLTEQEEPLLIGYLDEAARRMEERVSRMVLASEYTDAGFTWTLRTEETRWNVNRDLDRHISEALAAYAQTFEGRDVPLALGGKLRDGGDESVPEESANA